MNNGTPNAVLSAQDLHRHFIEAKNPVKVLKGVNFNIYPGERIAIMGSSGSGKSTLLHLLGGLDTATSGSVWLRGHNILELPEKKRCRLRNEALGFIYQFHHLLPEFTALENTAMPLFLRGIPVAEALGKAHYMLQRVGLSHRLSHKMHALSGGERQRVAVARAVIGQPDCILADEPTGNLDEKHAKKIMDLLLELNAQFKMALVIVTHDSTIAQTMQTRYRMRDGLLIPANA